MRSLPAPALPLSLALMLLASPGPLAAAAQTAPDDSPGEARGDPGGGLESDPAALRHNPFQQPATPAELPAPRAPAGGGGMRIGDDWQPELRAVLQAGDASLANVDGQVLAVGERIRGYRLIQVGERSAVLARGARRLELSLE